MTHSVTGQKPGFSFKRSDKTWFLSPPPSGRVGDFAFMAWHCEEPPDLAIRLERWCMNHPPEPPSLGGDNPPTWRLYWGRNGRRRLTEW